MSWIIDVNNYPLNQAITGVWVDTQITGLELPTMRTSSGNYAGRNGGYIGQQFFGPRSITLQGTIIAPDVATLAQTRQDIQNALIGSASGGQFPVTLQLLDLVGNLYNVYANLIDFQMPIARELFSAKWKIELLASDPVIYISNTYSVGVNIPLIVAGGYTYPVVYPVVYAPGSPPTTVTNTGSVPVYPLFTITGSATNPVITNQTTNQTFAIGITTATTDTLVINMQQRTVTLNGSSVLANVTIPTWLSLIPGGNSIAASTSNSTDTGLVQVKWQSGVMGI